MSLTKDSLQTCIVIAMKLNTVETDRYALLIQI